MDSHPGYPIKKPKCRRHEIDPISRKRLFKAPITFSRLLVTTQSHKLSAQSCTFVSLTVQFVSIASNPSTGQCEYLVDLEFDVQTNNGNKFIFIHLWEQSKYHFGSPGTALPFNYATRPTDDARSSSGILFSSLVNIGINSFVSSAAFYPTYPPDAVLPPIPK